MGHFSGSMGGRRRCGVSSLYGYAALRALVRSRIVNDGDNRSRSCVPFCGARLIAHLRMGGHSFRGRTDAWCPDRFRSLVPQVMREIYSYW